MSPPLRLSSSVSTLLTHWWMSLFGTIADVWMMRTPGQSVVEVGMVTHTTTTTSSNTKVRLCFRNYTQKKLLLCWMDSEGTPHHFYNLPDCQKNILASSSSGIEKEEAPISEHDHIEHSTLGHAFAIYEYEGGPEEITTSSSSSSLPPSILLEPTTRLVGGYRPTHAGVCNGSGDKQFPCHLIALHTAASADNDDTSAATSHNCFPMMSTYCKRQLLRGCSSASSSQADSSLNLFISSKIVYLDPTPIDTTSHKEYRQYFIADWPVFCTPTDYNSLTRFQLRALEQDLEILQNCLPHHAVKALKFNTPLYINKYFRYGPKLCPQRASGMCFHPHTDWLIQNGLHRQKVECVELYNLQEYMEERKGLWQPGGLLLHEFSHAYHYKMLPKGYSNDSVKQCYQQAMKEKLYDAVEYHKLDGSKHAKKTRAYACTDPMEYFAELSVAFLGGKDESVEFNKWFPFNRAQLKKHDPRAYKMLQRVWKMENDNNNMKD